MSEEGLSFVEPEEIDPGKSLEIPFRVIREEFSQTIPTEPYEEERGFLIDFRQKPLWDYRKEIAKELEYIVNYDSDYSNVALARSILNKMRKSRAYLSSEEYFLFQSIYYPLQRFLEPIRARREKEDQAWYAGMKSQAIDPTPRPMRDIFKTMSAITEEEEEEDELDAIYEMYQGRKE